jgi:hypothetical protein
VANAFANVAASTTDGALVAARTGMKIRVYSLACDCGATATNVTFNSKPAGSGVAISCLFAFGANGGMVKNYNPRGWFETAMGQGLTATTGTGATMGIQVGYDYLPS